MNDNPFAEPEDNDKTVIRPLPGGRRPASAPSPQPFPAAQAPQRDRGDVAAAVTTDGSEPLTIGANVLTASAAPLLQLLARLRNTASQPNASELRERAAREMMEFRKRALAGGASEEQISPAHYMLCASIDDVVLNTPWGDAGGWDSRSLVSTFHQEVRSGERFFDQLAKLKQNPGSFLPVIEIAYICLSLGFMGRYRLSPRGVSEIDKLREDTYALIARQRQSGAPDLSPHWKGQSAPYRPSQGSVPLWVAMAAGLAALGGLFAYFLIGLNADSDDLYQRMAAAAPSKMPTISRAAIQAPPPPDIPRDPSALDRLRTFLKPEIDQGLVRVLGTPSVPVVRINNRGMFASGSATLTTSVEPTLQRIGSALAAERGAVRVIGYTDNQPISTLQFPSNFQLSTARANSARAVIARTIGDPGRITAEGRADSDPVASNDNAEGREQNRRIEIVLHRQD